MARTRSAPAPQAPSGFVASAVRLPSASRNQAGRAEPWQASAWRFWETVGELRYVSTWIGNVLSRAQLTAAKRHGRLLVPETTGPAAEAMETLYGGPQGQAEMLQGLGVHLTVAGEAYVINRADGDAWNTLASGKVTQLPNGRLHADLGIEGPPTVLDTSKDLVMRIWTPHPKDPTKADSPVRPNLTTLAQIVAYDAHINAQIRSRLAGNGILFMSSDIDFPAPPDADPAATPAQNFLKMLTEAMITPIEDPGDPSALVPVVAMVPTDALGKQEHVRFWSELDSAVIDMRNAAIKRLALGLDVPPEVLLGVADANHWNAWLSEESAVKAHLEPRLAIIAFALTESFLRPALDGLVPDDELGDYFVIADTSGIRLRPNRSAEAVELYDRGELSGPALRRETGFQPEDAPAEEQFKEWLLKKVAIGSTTPEQSAAALHLLGIEVGLGQSPGQEPPDHLRIDTVPELEQRNPPSPANAEARAQRARDGQGLAAACDVLVFRALERAGNRLRNAHPRTDTTQIAATDVYRHLTGNPDTLLAGAWTCASDVLGPYTDDIGWTVDTLDFYVRGLLSSKRPHSALVLSALLAASPPSPIPLARV